MLRRYCNRRDSGASRGDGCELERSAASGNERNRPWRRPRDDFVGYKVHTVVENLSTSMCTFLFRICRGPQKYVPYVPFALPPVVVARFSPPHPDDRTHRGTSVLCVDAKPIYSLLSILF
jgi:hypothetical protein